MDDLHRGSPQTTALRNFVEINRLPAGFEYRYGILNEMQNRYSRIIRTFFYNVHILCNFLISTKSYMSGPAIMPMLFPSFRQHNDFLTYMHLLVRPDDAWQCISLLIMIEGYSFLVEDYECPQFQRYLQNGINGVHTILHFKRKTQFVTIIVSASNISSLYSLVYEPSTFTMNALSPCYFISFYPALTLTGQGLIHDFSYVCTTSNVIIEPRQLRGPSNDNINLYVQRGMHIQYSPNFSDSNHQQIC